MREGAYKQHFILFGYLIMISALSYVALHILGKYMLPFVTAWIAALLFQPLVNKCVRLTHLPRRLVGAIMLILMLAAGTLVVFLLVDRALSELKVFISYLGDNSSGIVENITGYTESVLEKLHLNFIADNDSVQKTVSDMIGSSIEKFTSYVTSKVGSFIMKTPGILFITVVFVMASFYLISDFEKLNRYIGSLMPGRTVRALVNIKNKILDTAVKYFRAYMIILLITFSELLAAFLILKVRYALLLALIIALLDLLPVIGVGTVLVPWAAMSMITGKAGFGIALMIVYIIISIVRQISETHIIGANLGLPAIVTLLSVYAGFRAAGIIGMIIGPFAAVMIKNFINYYYDVKNT